MKKDKLEAELLDLDEIFSDFEPLAYWQIGLIGGFAVAGIVGGIYHLFF